MGTGARRNRKAHMARLVDTTLRTVLTAAFGLVTRRARRRRGVHAVALTPERRIVLVRLRYAPGWRLPGGGLDAGEDLERAALRELREEIGITVKEACLAPLTFASHAYDGFHLLMPLYICRRWEGEVIAREGQKLAWVRANKLRGYPMPPADIPLIPPLIDLLM